MRKILLLILFCFSITVKSQVPRIVFGEMIFDQLYSSNSNPDVYDAVNFPNPFLDIDDTSESGKKIKILSYLEYQTDAETPFYRYSNFNPNMDMSRGNAIRAVVQAWDFPSVFYVTSPFNDVFPGDPFYGEFCAAYDYGMISGGTLNPYAPIDSTEANFYMDWIMNSQFDPVSLNTLTDLDNYFIPNNYQPNNIGFLRGLEQGVFSHYAKNSFVIPDRKFNLNFSHYYSTQLVELSESYFPIKPLGRGWTHTYNSYVQKETVNGKVLFYIVWADGTIHIWDNTDLEYITQGVYNNFTYGTGDDFLSIRTKDQTKYTFEQIDNDLDIFYLKEIKDSNDNIIEILYEGADESNKERITTVRAPSGKELNFFYHGNTDFIDYIQDPIGRQIRFTYNEERLKYFYDSKNQETKYYYLSNDEDAPDEHQYKRFLLRRVKLPKGNSIKAEFDDDDNGKLRSYQFNDNPSTEVLVSFDDYEAITSTVTVPMPNSGNEQDYTYQFNASGMVTDFQNDNQDINITYPDPTDDNLLLPTNIDVNGLDINYSYDDRGNVKSTQIENNEDEDFWYDANNNLIQYRDSNNNDTHFNYDGNSNLMSIEDALGNFINLTYDSFGQVLSITNQEGITVNYTYEDDGAVSTINAPEGLTSSFSYDGINRLLSQTINGQTSAYAYDPNDNLTSQTNIGGLTTTFDYDANDNLMTITNANNVQTAFTYNEEDQVTSETFNGLTKQYTYYDNGNLDRYIKPSGQEIDYDYTSDGKLNDAGTIADVDYYDDTSGKKEGLISSIASDDIRYNFNYDNLNRLEEVEINNDTDQTINYSYDAAGNLTRIYYPDSPSNFFVHYYYDAKNRLEEIKITANGVTKSAVIYDYLDDDRIGEVYYKNNSTFQIAKHHRYDNAGKLTGVDFYRTPVNSGTTTPLFNQAITLDNNGNILSDTSIYNEAIENEEDQNFNLQNETYAYNSNNHITQAGSDALSVNDDGNTTQKGNINYQYNIDDQLTSVTGNNGETNINFQLQYDAYGNRIEKNILQGTTNAETRRYVWDIVNNNVIKEYNPNGSEEYFYVYGATGLEFSVSPTTGGILRFYHGDIRGSVIFRSDLDANVVANHFNKYDDFGNVVTHYNADAEAFGAFTYLGKHGIVNDVTTQDGLYYIKARYYDAKLGRFLTQDPIWSVNLYPYAGNNPISRIDFNGKQSQSYLFRGDPLIYLSYSFSGALNDGKNRLQSFFKNTYDGFQYESNNSLSNEGNMLGQGLGIAFNTVTLNSGTVVSIASETAFDSYYGNNISSNELCERQIDLLAAGIQIKTVERLAKFTGKYGFYFKNRYFIFSNLNDFQDVFDIVLEKGASGLLKQSICPKN